MVLCGAHRGPPRHPTPTRRLQTRVRSRRVQSPVRATTPRRHPHQRRPGPPRHPLRHPPTPQSRLASTPRTPRYLADDHDGALEALDRFCDLYQTGELPEFHNIVNTIINWSNQILAWHHTNHPSNGRIEGYNNLLQVLRRTAHGFTDPTNFQARGLLLT